MRTPQPTALAGNGWLVSWLKRVYLILLCPTETYLSHEEFEGKLVSSPYPTPFIQCSQRLHPSLPSTTFSIQARWITSTTTPAPTLPPPLVRSSTCTSSQIRRRPLGSSDIKSIPVLFPIAGTLLSNRVPRSVYQQFSRLRVAPVSIAITHSSTGVQPSSSSYYWPEVAQEARSYYSGFSSQDYRFPKMVAPEPPTVDPTFDSGKSLFSETASARAPTNR